MRVPIRLRITRNNLLLGLIYPFGVWKQAPALPIQTHLSIVNNGAGEFFHNIDKVLRCVPQTPRKFILAQTGLDTLIFVDLSGHILRRQPDNCGFFTSYAGIFFQLADAS